MTTIQVPWITLAIYGIILTVNIAGTIYWRRANRLNARRATFAEIQLDLLKTVCSRHGINVDINVEGNVINIDAVSTLDAPPPVGPTKGWLAPLIRTSATDL